METRPIKSLLAGVLVVVAFVVPAANARASCAADPNDLSFAEMIQKDKTGNGSFDTLLLGYVVDIRDLEPGKGGQKLAKLVVEESPVGRAGSFARLHFYKPPPGGPDFSGNFVFHRNASYAVVAKQLSDRTWQFDGECGQTQRMSSGKVWRLVQLARTCSLTGTNHADVLRGTRERDVICGAGGMDLILGLRGDDLIRGGPGRDVVFGGRGRDSLYGYADRDRLFGGAGRDEATGNAGSDVVRGGRQTDDISGGIGPDRLSGGAHDDCMHSYEAKGVRSSDVANGNRGSDHLWADPSDRYTSTHAGDETGKTGKCFRPVPGIAVP